PVKISECTQACGQPFATGGPNAVGAKVFDALALNFWRTSGTFFATRLPLDAVSSTVTLTMTGSTASTPPAPLSAGVTVSWDSSSLPTRPQNRPCFTKCLARLTSIWPVSPSSTLDQEKGALC